MKSILALKAEEARIRAMLDGSAEADLRAIPGVVHVSVGLKQINGMATDEFSIRVRRAEEGSIGDSAKRADPKECRRHSDRRQRSEGGQAACGRDEASPHHGWYPDYQRDTECRRQHRHWNLGCLATDNLDGKTVLVTNFHVIGGTAGVSVFQPTNLPADLIGVVKRGGITGTIDAAIADIDPGIPTSGDEVNGLFLNLSNKIAGVANPVGGMRVFKVGRTTGLTDGKVVDSNATVDIDFDPTHRPQEVHQRDPHPVNEGVSLLLLRLQRGGQLEEVLARR